jgi:hypothetical protein
MFIEGRGGDGSFRPKADMTTPACQRLVPLPANSFEAEVYKAADLRVGHFSSHPTQPTGKAFAAPAAHGIGPARAHAHFRSPPWEWIGENPAAVLSRNPYTVFVICAHPWPNLTAVTALLKLAIQAWGVMDREGDAGFGSLATRPLRSREASAFRNDC